MEVTIDVVDDSEQFAAMHTEWSDLLTRCGGGFFRGPEWLLPWWNAYRRILDAKPFVIAGRSDGRLVLWVPLYRRVARVGPGMMVDEIRIMGDAGPRPATLDFTVESGFERAAGKALAEKLAELSPTWDLIDLEPMVATSAVRSYAINALCARGFGVESGESGGSRRVTLNAPGLSAEEIDADPMTRVYTGNASLLRKGLAGLRRLSRLEWADREETSPLADAEATRLLEEIVGARVGSGQARLARVDDADGAAAAAALVVDDGDHAVVLGLAVDPESRVPSAGARLLAAEARAAAKRNCCSLDVVSGAVDYELPPLPNSPVCAMRVSVYGDSKAAAVARTYGVIRRRVDAAKVAPGAAAASARAAWSKIRGAAGNVAARDRLQLYRGEMWTRGIKLTAGLSLQLMTTDEFDATPPRAQRDLVEVLELDPDACRAKWARGDFAAVAFLNGQPAGIGWCARSEVRVPGIDRNLALSRHEAYIYDVFVSPQARGRAVAPAMLEFMAKELRERDVYRSWAFIGSDNSASIRAFEKASYTAVAELVHTRVGNIERLSLRPPDPEAKNLLGLN